MRMKFKALVAFAAMVVFAPSGFSQCCGGGSGSPIAGGASAGVLQDRQMEINSSFQYVSTDNFYNGDRRDSATFFDGFSSNYIYTRVGYGVSKNFSMYVEAGYWAGKKQIGLDNVDTISSSGFGDLILFPRYDIINHTEEKKRVELTLGLGFKIPLGKYNDSVGRVEPFSGNTYYLTKPLSVQTSSGANDLIFNLFYFRGFPLRNFRLFANALYIKKGWNPIGEKIGDYASIGLFAGKTFYDKLGVTLQVRGEWVDKMKLNNTVLLYAYPNYDPFATGSRKVFFVPQVSYSFTNNFTLYALSEIPLYQYVVNNQAGSELQLTAGISYKFLTYKVGKVKSDNSQANGQYQCPMKCEGMTFNKPGKCSVCGMELEKPK